MYIFSINQNISAIFLLFLIIPGISALLCWQTRPKYDHHVHYYKTMMMMKDHVLAEDEVPRDNETQFKRMRGDDYRIHECSKGKYCRTVDCGNNTRSLNCIRLHPNSTPELACEKFRKACHDEGHLFGSQVPECIICDSNYCNPRFPDYGSSEEEFETETPADSNGTNQVQIGPIFMVAIFGLLAIFKTIG